MKFLKICSLFIFLAGLNLDGFTISHGIGNPKIGDSVFTVKIGDKSKVLDNHTISRKAPMEFTIDSFPLKIIVGGNLFEIPKTFFDENKTTLEELNSPGLINLKFIFFSYKKGHEIFEAEMESAKKQDFRTFGNIDNEGYDVRLGITIVKKDPKEVFAKQLKDKIAKLSDIAEELTKLNERELAQVVASRISELRSIELKKD